jgi:von Hippel-Lindau disease tumor supressor
MKRMILSFSILITLFPAFSQERSSPLTYFINPDISASDSSCEKESSLRSIEGVTPVEFTLINRSKIKIVLYWLNYEGKRVKYEEVVPGMQVKQPTFLTHPWVVADTKGLCIRILTPPGNFAIQ